MQKDIYLYHFNECKIYMNFCPYFIMNGGILPCFFLVSAFLLVVLHANLSTYNYTTWLPRCPPAVKISTGDEYRDS